MHFINSKNNQNSFLQTLFILGGIFFGIIYFNFFTGQLKEFRPEEFGLGSNTTSHTSEFEKHRISSRGQGQNVSTILEVQDTFKSLNTNSKILWLGASQLHSINHYKEGQQIAAYHATLAARKRSSNSVYLQVSSPNASLHDILGYYLSFRERGLKPDYLVVAIVYDDLREDIIQDWTLDILEGLELPSTTYGLGITHLSEARDLRDNEKKVINLNSSDLIESNDTPQASLELFLENLLESNWQGYSERGKILSYFRLAYLSGMAKIRGDLMQRQITPVPKANVQWNIDALKTIIRIAREDEVELLFYKQPHLPGEKIFYHNRENYDVFFKWLEQYCELEGVNYSDLEKIIPAEYWGMTNGYRPDVFHFQDYGHRKLGSVIDEIIAKGNN